MKKQYRNSLMASIHETVEGLHEAGVMDIHALRKFDEKCLTPVEPCNQKKYSHFDNENVQAKQFLPDI